MRPRETVTTARRADTCAAQLIIGIGSPHGDDRAGWEVVQQLTETCAERSAVQVADSLVLRKAAVPHDILDWLQRDTRTHIIDASSSRVPNVRRYEIFQDDAAGLCLVPSDSALSETGSPDSASSDSGPTETIDVALSRLRSSSSHQFDLLSTLQLAATLGSLPQRVVLWTVPIVTVEKNADLHAITTGLVADCANRICRELWNA